jgi:hypothetical protein
VSTNRRSRARNVRFYVLILSVVFMLILSDREHAAAAACTARLHAAQALADTWRTRAEHAEQQLDLERDHQRRLAAQPRTATSGNSDGAPAAPATARPAKASSTPSGSQP